MTTATSSVPEALDAYQAATAEVIVRYLSDREPSRHLYDPVRSFTMRQGKGLRPALCLAACEAFGGAIDDALLSAAAVELLHAAFLIHDDIEDGSEKRRGTIGDARRARRPDRAERGGRARPCCASARCSTTSTVSVRGMTRAVLAEFQLHDGTDRRRPGDRDRDGAHDNVDGSHARRLPRHDPAQDVRVHDDPAAPGGRDDRLVGMRPTSTAIAQFGFALGAAFQIQDDLLDLDQRRGRTARTFSATSAKASAR